MPAKRLIRVFDFIDGNLSNQIRLDDLAKVAAVIAYCCGFCSQSHFTTTFKRITGITPSRFRSSKSLLLALPIAQWLEVLPF